MVVTYQGPDTENLFVLLNGAHEGNIDKEI